MIRKIMLILKNMTSQPGKQTITILIFPNISKSKGNQMMKLGRVIEDKKRISFFFLKKGHSKNEAGRLVPDFFYFSIKLYMK